MKLIYVYLKLAWTKFRNIFNVLSADIFSSNLATALQAHLFISRIIKLLINAALSLPHPVSQAPFLSRIMLRLICL